MKKKIIYTLLIISLISNSSCKILKRKKKCDCPEWSSLIQKDFFKINDITT